LQPAPLTAHLFDAIRKHAAHTADVATQGNWATFSKFREEAAEPLRSIVNCKNLEVVLAIPDLLEAALDKDDNLALNKLKKAVLDDDQPAITEINQRWEHPARDYLVLGSTVRRCVLQLLDKYFSHLHVSDASRIATTVEAI
jgi:hypothetical protein